MFGALLFGGLICVIAQVLIDKTKITPARILVLFVTLRCCTSEVLEYTIILLNLQVLVQLFLSFGFGANLAKGAIKGVKEFGLLGAFTGGIKAAARWYFCCCILWLYCLTCS